MTFENFCGTLRDYPIVRLRNIILSFFSAPPPKASSYPISGVSVAEAETREPAGKAVRVYRDVFTCTHALTHMASLNFDSSYALYRKTYDLRVRDDLNIIIRYNSGADAYVFILVTSPRSRFVLLRLRACV